MATGFNRAEAERWLSVAEKVLSSHDFQGARSFAIRAREYDPSFEAPNQVLAVADTIIAGESIIITSNGNQYHDWYAILQLARFTHSIELIATQYRKLALLLSPERNRFPFADRSFKLVYDAWSILSNPARKIMYDTDLQLSQLGERPRQTQMPPPPQPPQPIQSQPVRRSPPPPARRSPPPQAKISPLNKDKGVSNRTVEEERSSSNNLTESTREARTSRTESNRPTEAAYEGPRFWTACPYCYILYEYPKAYEDCTLKCQNCKRAFHGVMIASPPVTEKDTYFCCWGFFPVGYSGNAKDTGGNFSKWTPVSPMFACPKPGQNNKKTNKRVQVLYDEVLISDSESDPEESDDEWGSNKKKKKAKNVKGKGNEVRKNVKRTPAERGKKGSQNQKENQNAGGNVDGMVGTSSGGGGARVLRSSGKKQMGNGLDLNVEFSNELEEPMAAVPPRMNPENGMEDNIDGVFFEGLDEFLSSLPILNVVKDDKVKPT